METIVDLSGFDKVDIDTIEKDRIFSNRKDIKFLFGIEHLSRILYAMKKDYLLMTVGSAIQHKYQTHYFDTPDLRFYTDHHNGILNRLKVRFRQYSDGKGFIEVKSKNNRGMTIKKRIPTDTQEEISILGLEHKHDLDLPANLELVLQLKVAYNRLTFYSRSFDEKVTIDTSIEYSRGLAHESRNLLVIAESKGINHTHSPFNILMKGNKFKRTSFSKYCYGISLLNPALKKNNFKSIHHKVDKLINAYELT